MMVQGASDTEYFDYTVNSFYFIFRLNFSWKVNSAFHKMMLHYLKYKTSYLLNVEVLISFVRTSHCVLVIKQQVHFYLIYNKKYFLIFLYSLLCKSFGI